MALKTEYHGSDGGGWAILKNSLSSSSCVVSVGVGEDASFDLSLIQKYGVAIYAFDPTPKAISWVRDHIKDQRFHLNTEALSDRDGVIRLYFPQNEAYVSASIAKNSNAFFDAPCISYETLLLRLNVEVIDVFKMDIEGAEYAVPRSMVASPRLANIRQLLIEFHHYMQGFEVRQTADAIASLEAQGFGVAWTSYTGHEILFINKRYI